MLFVGLLFVTSTASVPHLAGAATAGQDNGSIQRLYLAYFNRLPDDAGQTYWDDRLAAGLQLRVISDQFASSPEFQSTYGSLSDRQFVTLVYRNVLDRDPDQVGLDHWLGAMESGDLSRGGVMLAFSDSAEFKDSSGVVVPLETGPDGRSIERLYLAYFQRPAEAGGLRYWEGQLAGGVALTDVSQLLAASAEFTATYGSLSNDAFVALVYENVLERQPDPVGQAHWMLQLANGSLSRGGIMLAFSDSAEFKTATGIHGDRIPPEPDDIPQAGNAQGTAIIPQQLAWKIVQCPTTSSVTVHRQVVRPRHSLPPWPKAA